MAPTFGEMDIELSLSTTRRSVPSSPAWFMASYARPPVSAPSPMTAMTLWDSPFRSRALAKPNAEEIDVEACAVPNGSYSLSTRRGKPESPPSCRSVSKRSFRPVRILWG